MVTSLESTRARLTWARALGPTLASTIIETLGGDGVVHGAQANCGSVLAGFDTRGNP